MNRRSFITALAGVTASLLLPPKLFADASKRQSMIEKIEKNTAQWKETLTPEQFHVLRDEGTEAPFSSPLNDEKRPGEYICAGCELTLFSSTMKYDSGTGWPSFFTSIEDHVETKTDFKLIYPRTEYHCTRCGGHQGHRFKDGPEPTGQRWCNNGIALKFVPKTNVNG